MFLHHFLQEFKLKISKILIINEHLSVALNLQPESTAFDLFDLTFKLEQVVVGVKLKNCQEFSF